MKGDAAITLTLDCVEHAQKQNNNKNLRHHIAHIQVPNPQDIKRFAELNVSANFQPFWCAPDDDMVEFTVPVLGDERFLIIENNCKYVFLEVSGSIQSSL